MSDTAQIETQVKALNDKIGPVFEEFKKTNDRILEIEKKAGTVDPLLQEKLAKLETVIGDVVAVKDGQLQLKAAMERLARGGHGHAEEKETPQILEAKAAFNAFLRKGRFAGGENEFAYDKATSDVERKAMSVISDADGGYMVTSDMSGRIVKRIFETSPFRAYASVQGISTDALEGMLDNNEAGSGWVGEEEDRPETDTPEIGRYKIAVHEQYAMPKITQKLLDDAMVNVEQWLAEKVGAKFARAENTAFTSGDGVKRPRGILTYPSGTNISGQIEQQASGSNGNITPDTVIDLMYKLKSGYWNGAIFGANRLVHAQVRKLKDSTNQYLWNPGLNGSTQSNLLGFPLVDFPDMPVPATDALALFFANLKEGYQIVDRTGVRILRDPFTSKGFVKFYSTKRVGGGVINFEAIKLYKQGT